MKRNFRTSNLNAKKLNEKYIKTSNYKQYTSKFELPRIVSICPKVVKRKLDTTVYNRGMRVGSPIKKECDSTSIIDDLSIKLSKASR